MKLVKFGWVAWFVPDVSPCPWNGVSTNQEDLSYMFDETTPIKACGDFAYHDAGSGWTLQFRYTTLSD